MHIRHIRGSFQFFIVVLQPEILWHGIKQKIRLAHIGHRIPVYNNFHHQVYHFIKMNEYINWWLKLRTLLLWCIINLLRRWALQAWRFNLKDWKKWLIGQSRLMKHSEHLLVMSGYLIQATHKNWVNFSQLRIRSILILRSNNWYGEFI